MAYKHILVPVISIDEDQAALEAAAALAEQFGARAAALILAVHLSSNYASEAQPLSAVLEDVLAGARSQAALERERVVTWLDAHEPGFERQHLTIESAVDQNQIAAFARVSDIIVASRAAEHTRARQAMFEDVLFHSGRPLLLVPARRRAKSFEKILIGWNARQEAVRAIIGAMPLLQSARKVSIATVDASPGPGGHAPAPGQELAAYLALHGVTADVHNIDGMGRTHALALQDDAIAMDADLIVLGAYGHSRAREFVFGGVTRELLIGSQLPLLMAH